MKKVAVIIVTYNRLQLLKEEIQSIRKQTYTNFEIVVVNNGSTDGTLDWLNTEKDIITITQENQGCTGGMFTGIKYAVENGYDICWVMDDDVEYHENSLEELMRSYDMLGGEVGYLCSKVEGINGEPMNVPVVDIRPTGNGYGYYYEYIAEQMIKTEMATFVSLLFSSDVVKKVGLPLKEFFIWSDDYEFTERISKHYPCYLCCKSVVVHKRTIQGALSFNTEKDPRRLKNYFYYFRNGAYIVKKYKGNKAYARHLLGLSVRMLRCLFKGEFLKSQVIIKSIFSALTFHPVVKYPHA